MRADDPVLVAQLRLDLKTGEAFWRSAKLELPHLSFRLLYILAKKSPDIVSQKELVDFVWEGIAVSDDTLKQRISLLRDSLQQYIGQQSLIETVRGQGYRFKSPPASHEKTPGTPRTAINNAWPKVALASFVILLGITLFPFSQNTISGPTRVAILSPETTALTTTDNWWIKAIQQEVEKQLISMQGFSVASENHTPSAAIELKSTYVRTDGKLHVAYQLIDVANSTIIWSHSFELAGEKTHTNPSNVSGYITLALHSRFAADSKNGMQLTSSIPAEAYDLYLVGMQFIFKPTAPENSFAQEHFKNALELYADFDLARAALAIAQADHVLFYSGTKEDAQQSLRNATIAQTNQPQLAEAQYAYGLACLANGHIEEGLKALDRAALLLPYLNRKIRGYKKRFGPKHPTE